jgi:D-amino peptidase
MKLNGKQLGELDFDSNIAGEFGVPAIFAASDDICINQMAACNPDTVTAITKYAKGRNAAEFRAREEVAKDIYEGVKLAASKTVKPVTFTFPCSYEIRYTRMEMAAWIYEGLKEKLLDLRYGEDAHTLQVTLRNIDDLRLFL